MPSLEKRVAKLEGVRVNADLHAMTDEELSDYLDSLRGESPALVDLKGGTSRWWDAVLANVARHPSALKVVQDDPAYAGGKHGIH